MATATDEPLHATTDHPLAFQALRWRQGRNAAGQLLSHSFIRVVTILLCSLVVWGTVYGVSHYGFRVLQYYKIPLAFVGILYDYLFLALAMMLLFSTSIMLFSSLFTSPEARFLLTLPARADHVFAYRFQSVVGFSSWAFVLLGSPIPIAYGVVTGSPWYFYLLLPLFFIGYVLVPASLGALACLLVVNFLPRKKTTLLVLILVVLTLSGVAMLVRAAIQARATSDGRQALQSILMQFSFAQSSWAPSHWMSQGLMAAARGDVARIGLPLALVWSNGLFAYLLAAASARLLYRRGYDIIAGSGGSRRVYRSGRLDQVARWLVGYLDRPTRLLVEKDFRTFRRDPGQWAQILVFAGLVLFYFLNFRRFYQADIGKPFQNGISLLNLSATAMLMCAYMGRFVYPMLSLEGRKFWVLGLLPLPRTKLLIGKFAFAATGSVLIAEVLIIVSDLLLGMPPGLVLIHALAVLVIALGLSGMSVGLGAAMPNFREADGSKIAVGFGGTLNLILSLLYLVLVIALMAGPYHAALALELADRNGVSAAMAFRAWIIPGVVLGVLVGVVAVLVPMRLGARSLRRMEF